MKVSKKISIFCAILLFILSLSLFLINDNYKFIVAIFLFFCALFLIYQFRKRKVVSVYKRQVIIIATFASLVYLMAFYLFSSKYGYHNSLYPFTLMNVLKYLIPTIVAIVSYEIIRFALISQENKMASITAYIAGVLLDVIFLSTIIEVKTVNNFMDLVGHTILPAVISNVLFFNLSKNYGIYPNILYRLVTSIYLYIIPIVPAVPESLEALYRLFFPVLLLIFIKTLYEKQHKKALEKKSIFSNVIFGSSFVVVIVFTLILSGMFSVKALVIATESMTGEINKGDILLYEEYKGEGLSVGEVIVFSAGESIVVHRIVDIKEVDGELRYYTKGDANLDTDDGYRTKTDIVGLSEFKLPYFGYLTLWLHEIFA